MTVSDERRIQTEWQSLYIVFPAVFTAGAQSLPVRAFIRRADGFTTLVGSLSTRGRHGYPLGMVSLFISLFGIIERYSDSSDAIMIMAGAEENARGPVQQNYQTIHFQSIQAPF